MSQAYQMVKEDSGLTEIEQNQVLFMIPECLRKEEDEIDEWLLCGIQVAQIT